MIARLHLYSVTFIDSRENLNSISHITFSKNDLISFLIHKACALTLNLKLPAIFLKQIFNIRQMIMYVLSFLLLHVLFSM